VVLGEIFGREHELAMLAAFVDGLAVGPRALVIVGEAGAGKTTLFDTAVRRATELGVVVLETRPAETDAPLSFAGLADLFEARLDDVLDELPKPQRRALMVAFLLEDAPERPPERHAVAAAARTALRALSRTSPVLVAVDDVQWLDAPTGEALGFTFRRLEGEAIGLLCAERTDRRDSLPLSLDRARVDVECVPVGPLSIGALHHLLRTRLGASFSRPTLRRIEAASGGNPFIALELARALERRGAVRVDAETRLVPETVGELVRERLESLPDGGLDVLRAVALMADPTVAGALAVAGDAAGLDAAVTAGFLEVDGDRLRFSHPLVASAVAGSIPPSRSRELHALLAEAASDPEERARHLALAARGPSASTSAELESAARLAAARGASASAADLFELAARLTPPDLDEAAFRRKLEAADYLSLAGETRASRTLLEELVASTPPGAERAEALTRLAWNREDDFEAASELLEQALAEAGEEPRLRADIHLSRSDTFAIRGDRLQARAEARDAVAQAEQVGDDALLASSLAQVVVCEWLCEGHVDDALLERALALERSAGTLRGRTPPSNVAGICYSASGRFDEAREALQAALARAEAEGVEYWRGDTLLRLSLTESRAGNLERAEEHAAAGLEVAEQLGFEQLTSALLYGRGLAALLRGRPEEARRLARRGIELSAAAGDEVYATSNEALIGLIQLTVGDHDAAATRLLGLWGRMEALGRRPSTQGVLPNAVEALVAAGRLDEARLALVKLEGETPDPATVALVARSRGALEAAEGQLEQACATLDEALRLHEAMPMPLERGRTLLVLGGVLRRLKRRRAARGTLLEAFELFERIGAPLWAEQARAELARVSGRSPGSDELTESELRVAELVGQGRTNKEVAAALFLSVRGVESTLSKVYRKLGVRSRTELAAALRERP
jgi:DNA-binding CsgD family transcriptional regulator